MAAKPQVTIFVDDKALEPKYLRLLRGLEVQQAVHTQAQFHLRFSIGQDATGDWAAFAEKTFKPSQSIKIEAKVTDRTVRLINGILTQLKMNFKADPCESEMELSGFDALEKLKRSQPTGKFKGRDIPTVVNYVFDAADIAPADTAKIPNLGASDPQRKVLMQAHDDLEFLRMLATTVNCEVYVEPTASADQGHFEPLDLDAAQELTATINVNQGDRTNVRNAQFYYDLSQETVVEADFVDANGKHTTSVTKSLGDQLSERDKTVLGPPGFQSVKRLERHGREDRKELERLCEAELDKLAWVVIGKGELDSAAYGDVLVPRHRVVVNGAATAFNGRYLVWSVKHTFTRELYCQSFELRRKLGVQTS